MARRTVQPSSSDITSVLKEKRVFKPSAAFSGRAQVKSMKQYEKLRAAASRDPLKFWSRAAGELDWFKKWTTVLKWKLPFAEWFVGGKINASYNCLDRHLTTWRKNKAALIWEGEPGDTRVLTYQQLHHEVCKCSNVLKNLGVKKGDRVAIYMPLVPELAIAMLACARIGATHCASASVDRSVDGVRKRVADVFGVVPDVTAFSPVPWRE